MVIINKTNVYIGKQKYIVAARCNNKKRHCEIISIFFFIIIKRCIFTYISIMFTVTSGEMKKKNITWQTPPIVLKSVFIIWS